MPATAATKRRATSYQIIVKHTPGSCPAMPDGFSYEQSKYSVYRCPVHQVFNAECTVNEARAQLDRLKAVDGLTELWLTKNGYAMDRERWVKVGDGWEKD